MPTLQWIHNNGNYYYFGKPAKPITTPWIYHNATLGLISLSSDGSNWITIADKNIGATSTNVSSTNSYGNYYSRWALADRNWKTASWYTMQQDWSLWTQSIAPSWFHIPTQSERTSIVTTMSSIIYISSLNYNYAMKYLLLPRAWQMLDNSTTVSYTEDSWWWYYWTSTKSSSTSAYLLRSTSSTLNSTDSAITYPRWFTIRCIKDISQIPTKWGDWLDLISLKNYSWIEAIFNNNPDDSLVELNKYPVSYYNKFLQEWNMSWNYLSRDWTETWRLNNGFVRIAYNSGTNSWYYEA